MEKNKNLKLKAARTLLGMTQNDLAIAVGVTRQTIVSVESGKYNPTITLCLDICHALGKTLDELFWQADNAQNERRVKK